MPEAIKSFHTVFTLIATGIFARIGLAPRGTGDRLAGLACGRAAAVICVLLVAIAWLV